MWASASTEDKTITITITDRGITTPGGHRSSENIVIAINRENGQQRGGQAVPG